MGLALKTPKVPQRQTMLSTQDLADRWGLSMKLVRKLMETGDYPQPVRFGKLLMFPLQAVEAFEKRATEKSLERALGQ